MRALVKQLRGLLARTAVHPEQDLAAADPQQPMSGGMQELLAFSKKLTGEPTRVDPYLARE